MALVVLLSGFACGVGALLLVCALGTEPPEFIGRLEESADRQLRFLRSPLSAKRLLGLQGGGLGLGVLVLGMGETLGLIFVGLSLATPLFLRVARVRRVNRLEPQIEGWLGALGRALEASPSLGEALSVSAEMVDSPLKDEIEETLSELNLGLPMDRALLAMGQRVGSRTLQLALATLQVGRETGGELPDVLRKAAAALREMARLEGVLRTKTAEGKTQAMVISVLPAVLYGGLRFSDPDFFLPLETTPMGHVLLGVAALFWVGSGFLAYKILSVQL